MAINSSLFCSLLGLGPQQQPPLYRADSQNTSTIQAHLTSNHSTLMQGKCHQIYDYGNHIISLFSPLGLGPQQQPQLYRADFQAPATIQAHLTSHQSTLTQGKCYQMYGYGNRFTSSFSPLDGPHQQPQLYRELPRIQQLFKPILLHFSLLCCKSIVIISCQVIFIIFTIVANW